MSESAAFGAALAHVQQRVERACARAGRDPAAVRLLPVSKAVPVDRLRAALELGVTTFGENRVQEAAAKAVTLPAARWELIGHLQSNKAARAVTLFDAIHSVDSVELARRLDRLAGDTGRPDRLSVYLEINVDADPAKSGFDPPTIEAGLTE